MYDVDAKDPKTAEAAAPADDLITRLFTNVYLLFFAGHTAAPRLELCIRPKFSDERYENLQ